MTHLSAEAPSASHLSLLSGRPLRVRAGGLGDLLLGGVELRRRRRATGGEGDRRLLTGEGDLAARFLGGEMDGLAGDTETLRRGEGDRDLRRAGEIDLPLRRGTGDRDLRSPTSYLGAESIMTESPE